MKKAIVIGSGAGGAMMAKELQGRFQVTILEAGSEFRPFSVSINRLAGLRKTGLFLYERMISMLFPAMRVQKASSGMVLVHGKCTGGTTALATGSAIRCDKGLAKPGINLDQEFEELSWEIPLSTDHEQYWSSQTKALFDACVQLGFQPAPTAKLVNFERCVHCGRCVLGCRTGAKWDSRTLLSEAVANGATLKTNCEVTSLDIDRNDHTVHTVRAKEKGKQVKYSADLVILAAGGFGTPVILEHSGIACENTLFVDPVLCVAAPYPGAGQDRHIPMPFLMQRDGYMLSPYMDSINFLTIFVYESDSFNDSVPDAAATGFPVSGQLPFGQFPDHARLCDDHAVHRGGRRSAEGCDRVAVGVIRHSDSASAAVQIALSAALAVFRVGQHGFAGLLIKIEDIRTSWHLSIFSPLRSFIPVIF